MADTSNNFDDTAELDVFIVNEVTNEVHHKNFEKPQCHLHAIANPVVARSLVEARKKHNADPCGHCFRSRH